MLVSAPRDEVGSVDVSPVPVLWECCHVDLLPSHLLGAFLSLLELVLLNATACALLRVKEAILRSGVSLVLGVLFVPRVVLLLLGRLMLDRVAPSIRGGGPRTVRLNADVVDAADHSEEAIFSPVSAPRVPHQPVLGAILDAEADN